MARRLGQHFLARKSILENIASAACDSGVPLVVEIGPGKGALTEPLLALAAKVVAIEVHPYLVHYLRDFSSAFGAAGLTQTHEHDGFSTHFDFSYGIQSFLSMGLWERPWESISVPWLRTRGVVRARQGTA